jgi:hypothetical protein
MEKFWWSGEIQADVDDSYSRIMNLLETELNQLLTDISFGGKAEQWAFIGIIRQQDSPNYDEVVRKSSRGRVLEFRLKIPHAEFLGASPKRQIGLILGALFRSVALMERLGVSADVRDRLQEILKETETKFRVLS